MKRIRVPEEMIEEVRKVDIFKFSDSSFMSIGSEGIRKVLEAALLWLSENPQVPTDEQLAEIAWPHKGMESFYDVQRKVIAEWQRRCFQEEPEIPAEIEDLLEPRFVNALQTVTRESDHDKCVIEAYRRGLHKRGE